MNKQQSEFESLLPEYSVIDVSEFNKTHEISISKSDLEQLSVLDKGFHLEENFNKLSPKTQALLLTLAIQDSAFIYLNHDLGSEPYSLSNDLGIFLDVGDKLPSRVKGSGVGDASVADEWVICAHQSKQMLLGAC